MDAALFAVVPGLARLDAFFAFYDPSPAIDTRLQSLSSSERLSLRADILNSLVDNSSFLRVLRLEHALDSVIHQREVLERMVAVMRADLDQSAREAAPAFADFVDSWIKNHPSPSNDTPTSPPADSSASHEQPSVTPAPAPAAPPLPAAAPTPAPAPVIAVPGPNLVEEDAVSLDFEWDDEALM